MIGIDLTRISRFNKMNLRRLSQMLGQHFDTATGAAKTWVCIEALIKAEKKKFNCKNIQLVFNKNSPPIVIDNNNILSGKYELSISHEGDFIIGIAIRIT